jgi:hypothetical protein
MGKWLENARSLSFWILVVVSVYFAYAVYFAIYGLNFDISSRALTLVKLRTTAEQPRNSYKTMNRSKLINEPDIKSVKQHHPRQLINLIKND